jgi:Holliday junction resolvase RusA-like endonuclease
MAEITLPFDFIVEGVPATHDSGGREKWKLRVRDAARCLVSNEHQPLAMELSVAIVYFSESVTSKDVDNIIKPILDALIGIVYRDDRIVSQVLARKTQMRPDRLISVSSRRLAEALERGLSDFVYIMIRLAPDHSMVPQ